MTDTLGHQFFSLHPACYSKYRKSHGNPPFVTKQGNSGNSKILLIMDFLWHTPGLEGEPEASCGTDGFARSGAMEARSAGTRNDGDLAVPWMCGLR